MPRITYYPTVIGSVKHISSKSGPKPVPDELRKTNITVRLYGRDVCRIEQAAAAARMTRQAWLEHSILDGLRNAETSQ